MLGAIRVRVSASAHAHRASLQPDPAATAATKIISTAITRGPADSPEPYKVAARANELEALTSTGGVSTARPRFMIALESGSANG